MLGSTQHRYTNTVMRSFKRRQLRQAWCTVKCQTLNINLSSCPLLGPCRNIAEFSFHSALGGRNLIPSASISQYSRQIIPCHGHRICPVVSSRVRVVPAIAKAILCEF